MLLPLRLAGVSLLSRRVVTTPPPPPSLLLLLLSLPVRSTAVLYEVARPCMVNAPDPNADSSACAQHNSGEPHQWGTGSPLRGSSLTPSVLAHTFLKISNWGGK